MFPNEKRSVQRDDEARPGDIIAVKPLLSLYSI
jgi:hypothetical protein